MSFDTFQGSARPSLGVELELQLVDARTLALTAGYDKVIAGVPTRYKDSVKPEFYHCCVEINTGVCRDVDEVAQDLGPKLAAASRAAARRGVLVGWGGTHPFSHWRDQPVVATPRYVALAERYRETLCRQVTFGLHVHVGVGDGDAAVRVCNGIVQHLPALLALSANSPFWCGRATGLRSHRVEVMGASPTGGLPPCLKGWDDYVGLVGRLTGAGLIETAKELWWDVRPSPEYGTVEVRMCDMPPDLPSVLALTALTQCLVVDLARKKDGALDECGLMVARQNRWRAARYGLDAEFIDPRTTLPSSARETIRNLVERLARVGEELGCARQLGCVSEMAEGESGADRQLAVHQRTGDLLDVVRWQTNGSSATSGPVPSAIGAAPCPAAGGPGVVGAWSRPLSAAGVFGAD